MIKLILWDIDGTLIYSNGVGGNALLRAFNAVRGHDPNITSYSYGGKTDPQIMYELMARHDIGEEAATTLMPEALKQLAVALAQAEAELRRQGEAVPGVREVLEELGRRGIKQSLLTGNIEPNAIVKLKAFALDGYFDWSIGAFGSDDRYRNNLVAVARAKARDRGFEIAPTEIAVIGDTPLDIVCGKAGGTRTVALAGRNFTVEELAAHNPDAVLSDLHDTAAAVEALLGTDLAE